MTRVDRCADCNASLGTLTQETLPGVGVEKRCPGCETQRRTRWMLQAIPTEDEPGWDALSEWEQQFVASVRRQFAQRGTITEAQYQKLEQVYRKV